MTLNGVDIVANHTAHNSDKSDVYDAVMIYQSMSGDAEQGVSLFAMNGGTMTNKNGDVFFVNNTVTTIDLNDAVIKNEDPNGVFLRAAAASWGSLDSNGGQVTLNASSQDIEGSIVVDDASTLNLYLKDESAFHGSINTDEQTGEEYVEIEEGSIWVLDADSHITSLTCPQGAIDLNGHKLFVNGQEYEQGSTSVGQAVAVKVSEGQHPDRLDNTSPDGMGAQEGFSAPPDGAASPPPDGNGAPPPDGFEGGEQPLAKPDGQP